MSYFKSAEFMTPRERLEELAEILARGYLRMLAIKEKETALQGDSEGTSQNHLTSRPPRGNQLEKLNNQAL